MDHDPIPILPRLDALDEQLERMSAHDDAARVLADQGYNTSMLSPERTRAVIHAFTSVGPQGVTYRERRFDTTVGLARWLTQPFRETARENSWPILELLRSVCCEQRAPDPVRTTATESPPDTPSESPNREHTGVAKANLERLIEQNWALVRGYAVGHGGSDETATEAIGRAFTKFWSPASTERFAGMSRVSTLLCSFARFVLLEQNRDRPGTGRQPDDLAGATDEPATAGERAEIRDAYERCLEGLTARERTILDLHIRYQMAGSLIADRLGCGRPNISNALAIGLPKLRACMERKHFFWNGG